MTPKKVLVIRNDHIGDMVISTLIFRELKKAFPKTEITAIVSPANKAIVEENKNIENIIVLKTAPRKIKDFYRYFKASLILRKEKFDVGIDLRGGYFNALLMWASGVKYKIGFYEHESAKKYLNFAYKRDKDLHEANSILELINGGLRLKSKDYMPDVQTSSQDKINVDAFLKQNKIKKYICLVPEATFIEKQWPTQYMDDLINKLNKNYPNYKILLFSKEMHSIQELLDKNPKCVPVIGKNLREVYLLLKNSSVNVAPDGGPLQLASASNSNVIALMQKDLPIKHVRPLGKKCILIVDEMKNMTVKKVYDKITKILKNRIY